MSRPAAQAKAFARHPEPVRETKSGSTITVRVAVQRPYDVKDRRHQRTHYESRKIAPAELALWIQVSVTARAS
jgi:hypothetical protein